MTKSPAKFPSRSKLKTMDEKLRHVSGTFMVGPSSSPAERFRWELCQRLVKYMSDRGMSQVEFAAFLEIDQARVSEITNHRINKVSTDKLLLYNEKTNPHIEFKIAK